MIKSSLLEAVKLRLNPPVSKEIKRVFSSEPSSDFDLSSRGLKKLKGQHKKTAAVFMLLMQKEKDVSVIFTKRADNLSTHPGQISFPGGSLEPNDESMLNAGLREVKEEIGLEESQIETVGMLRPHETVSKYLIHPFIGIMESTAEFKINTSEVAEIFEVPLAFLLNRKNMKKHRISNGKEYRGYFAIPYGPHYIWGATASIIKSFTERYHR